MDITNNKNLQSVYISDVGCVRELNEDSVYCSDSLWLVADGMGGHACGEVASAMAIESIVEEFNKTADLSAAIQLAHDRITFAGSQSPSQAGMGTTIVAVTSNQESYQLAWVGDSRIYLFDSERQKLTQLSQDHSLIVRLIKSGLISAEDAKKHPQRHMITQCLGSIEIKQLEVDELQANWLSGQQLMMCSDGLTDDINEDDILKILLETDNNKNKLEKLVELAKKAGGKDNISIVLIDSPIAKKTSFWGHLKRLF